jgi:hypothetical protein
VLITIELVGGRVAYLGLCNARLIVDKDNGYEIDVVQATTIVLVNVVYDWKRNAFETRIGSGSKMGPAQDTMPLSRKTKYGLGKAKMVSLSDGIVSPGGLGKCMERPESWHVQSINYASRRAGEDGYAT